MDILSKIHVICGLCGCQINTESKHRSHVLDLIVQVLALCSLKSINFLIIFFKLFCCSCPFHFEVFCLVSKDLDNFAWRLTWQRLNEECRMWLNVLKAELKIYGSHALERECLGQPKDKKQTKNVALLIERTNKWMKSVSRSWWVLL